MLAYGAKLRRLGGDMEISAVAAEPDSLAAAGKDDALLQVAAEPSEALLV